MRKLNITQPQPSLLRDVNALHDKAISVIDKFDAERAQALRYDTALRRKFEAESLQRVALAELAVTARDVQRYADSTVAMRRSARTLKAPEPSLVHGEIRRFFLNLTAAERKLRVDAALDANDRITIDSLIHAPAFLSGLTDKQQAAMRERVIESVSGEELRDLAELESAIERAQAVIETARQHVQETEAEAA